MSRPTDERLAELTTKLENGIKELYASGKYAEYLRAMSKFHRYSFGNALLILFQCPTATRVAGYTTWKKDFGRNVKRHEKGIQILAPCPTKQYIWQEVTDPTTGKVLCNPDGSPRKETQPVTITRFKVATVFDVSQTEGKELPTLGVARLTGDVTNYAAMYDKLIRLSPVPVQIDVCPGEANGYFSASESRIVLRPGMSQIQTLKTLIHEIAHAKLHNYYDNDAPEDATTYQTIEIFDIPGLFSDERIDPADIPSGLFCYDLRGSDDDPGMPVTVEKYVKVNHAASILTAEPLNLPEDGVLYLGEEGLDFTGDEITAYQFLKEHPKDRHIKEVEAESIAYVVCQHFGIDTSEYSFGYVAGWSRGKEMDELKSSLDLIHSTAGEMIAALDDPCITRTPQQSKSTHHYAR